MTVKEGDSINMHLMRTELRLVLEKAGVNLEVSEKGVEALRRKKYTEKYPNRRLGLVEVWGEVAVVAYEEWADEMSADKCVRFVFKGNPIDGSESRGLRQLLADFTWLVVDDDSDKKLSVKRFEDRMYWRIKKGSNYWLMKRAKKDYGNKSEEYLKAKDLYVQAKEIAKRKVGVVAMVPPEAAEALWQSLQQGKLPSMEDASGLK